jgi:hypothetical protein
VSCDGDRRCWWSETFAFYECDYGCSSNHIGSNFLVYSRPFFLYIMLKGCGSYRWLERARHPSAPQKFKQLASAVQAARHAVRLFLKHIMFFCSKLKLDAESASAPQPCARSIRQQDLTAFITISIRFCISIILCSRRCFD